jgi:hypothetical protein
MTNEYRSIKFALANLGNRKVNEKNCDETCLANLFPDTVFETKVGLCD